MGGVEDEEPASKRMKLASAEFRALSNGSSKDLMARPLPSEGDNGKVIGSRGVIKRDEFVRIIANALYSLGYKNSSARLEEESGIPLRSSSVNIFMQQILDGNWDESIKTLHKFGLSNENMVKSACFLILEQKYLELLEIDKVMEALKTLRTEIAPLSINIDRIHELSSFVMSPSWSGLIGEENSRGKSRTKLLEELQKLLPPAIMIPENRLEDLVEQALLLQRDSCVYHNASDQEMSLYMDHDCGKHKIPSQTFQVLQAHSDEVWFLQFSHNGKFLASSSSDLSAIIWEVNSYGKFSSKHKLSGHQKPVSLISWSPDDNQLLTCGVEEVIRRWDVSTGKCLHVYEKAGFGMLSCGWFPDGKSILAGINDKSISMWDLDGKELDSWKGQRISKISDLEISDDGKNIITICRETAILLLDRETKIDRWIEEDQAITSFQLSKDNKFLLVNLLNQEIHLWSLVGEPNLVCKYTGHKRARFVIRSCFGGLEEAFIASGSEDSRVYIWHRGSGELIKALAGHSGSVNCVSWNPTNPHMLASASDDHTVRIWGVKGLNVESKNAYSNGVHYCNGGA